MVETRSRSGFGRMVHGASCCVDVEARNVLWDCLSVRIASIRYMVCQWVGVYHTIFQDMRGLLRTGIDRSIWATRVIMESWYWVDSTWKVCVLPWSGLWVVVRIMGYYCDRFEWILTIGQAIGDCQTSLQHFALIMIFLPQPKQNKYKNHQFLFQIRIAPIPINSIWGSPQFSGSYTPFQFLLNKNTNTNIKGRQEIKFRTKEYLSRRRCPV